MNNQVAAEAAGAIAVTLNLKPEQIPGLELVILSAIEKAIRVNELQRHADFATALPESRAVHASEQGSDLLKQGWVTRGTIADSAGTCHIRITEQERRDIIAALQSRAAQATEVGAWNYMVENNKSGISIRVKSTDRHLFYVESLREAKTCVQEHNATLQPAYASGYPLPDNRTK